MSQFAQIKKDIGHLEADLGKLMTHLKKGGRQFEIGSHNGEDSSPDAVQYLKSIVEQVQSSMEGFKDTVKEQGQKAEKAMVSHPWVTLVSAMTLGVFLGKLLDLRGQDR